MVSALPGQLRVYRALLRPEFAPVVNNSPYLLFKGTHEKHLALGFTAKQRAASLAHHYEFLCARLPAHLLRQVVDGSVVVFRASREEHDVQIQLGRATYWHLDGELAFTLLLDGEAIFSLAFTVVPGAAVAGEEHDVVLMSRLQGLRGRQPQVMLAARVFHEVSPAAMLLAALHGFAEAFHLQQIFSVSADNQPYYTAVCAASFRRAYDEFLFTQGAIPAAPGFFSIPVPAYEKPLEMVKKNNRLRTKIRRSFKRSITAEVQARLSEQVEATALLTHENPPGGSFEACLRV